ncbi:hypothetical protein D9M73_244680 [compost metagenome]
MCAELELKADLEHQQDQADLRGDHEGGGRLRYEQRGQLLGEEIPQQARTEHQPGKDFAGDRRLAQAAGAEPGDQPRDAEDHDELQQKHQGQVLRLGTYG